MKLTRDRKPDQDFYRSQKQAPFARHDPKAAAALAPQAAWLDLATPTGIYQAVAN